MSAENNSGCDTSGWNGGALPYPDVRHPGGMSARSPIRSNSIRIPQEDMWRAPLSGFENKIEDDKKPSSGVSGRPVRMIAYPIQTAFHCFAMDSKELSSILDCFGDQITNKKHQNLHNLIRMDCKGP